MEAKEAYVIGVDFGTDSARAILLNAKNGKIVSSYSSNFKRWSKGEYCNPIKNQFRQHPLDYIESLEECLLGCLKNIEESIKENIVAISVDTTGSTPVAVDKKGNPLALNPKFAENPNAMFFLWKDHTSIAEAKEINNKAKNFPINYLDYVGGAYSSEWFWSKLLYVLRHDKQIGEETYSWVEQSDWIPYHLLGIQDATKLKRNVCAAGHKGLWAKEFNGFPPSSFFEYIDSNLVKIYESIDQNVLQADQSLGFISNEWANKLGIPKTVKIGAGAIDAHVGAIGAEISPGYICKVMGTSTCDMMVIEPSQLNNILVPGICGQVTGSIVPNFIGLEAGQSAFGDVYSWFKELLLWPINNLLDVNNKDNQSIKKELEDQILINLSKQASLVPIDVKSPISLDWFNGRRTPYVDPEAKGAVMDLNLGSNAVSIFQSLVEATCFGSRAIIEHMVQAGVPIEGVIAIGGIAKKSDYVMQLMADILQRPIKVHSSTETCALGACMLASTVAGVYETLQESIQKIGSGFEKTYFPDATKKDLFDLRYYRYKELGRKIYNN